MVHRPRVRGPFPPPQRTHARTHAPNGGASMPARHLGVVHTPQHVCVISAKQPASQRAACAPRLALLLRARGKRAFSCGVLYAACGVVPNLLSQFDRQTDGGAGVGAGAMRVLHTPRVSCALRGGRVTRDPSCTQRTGDWNGNVAGRNSVLGGSRARPSLGRGGREGR